MEAFKAHCRVDQTIESCGLFVLKDGVVVFVPCENHAYDKTNSFIVHPSDFVRESDEGDVIGVGHSHVIGPSTPSGEDRINAENCMLPFVIYQPEADTVGTYDPKGVPTPLLGRKWVLGVSDCYTLARDYYRTQGLELKDYVRNDMSILRTNSLFLQYYEENGFHVIEGLPKIHDALLIQVHANIPNHVAVMVDNNLILHHLQDRLSCREPYGGYWRRHTMKVLRHEKWL